MKKYSLILKEETSFHLVHNVQDINDTLKNTKDEVIGQIRDILSTLSFREALPVYFFLRWVPTLACYTYIYKVGRSPAGVCLMYETSNKTLYIVIQIS